MNYVRNSHSKVKVKKPHDSAQYRVKYTSYVSNDRPEFPNCCELKVIYHPLYSMNKFVTNKSKLPQDGAQVFPYMG